MNLCDIARTILAIEDKPISKVRFAKTIYFVHKELIRSGMMGMKDIAYIRMPLGPVPFGFMTLEKDCKNIQVSRDESGHGLAYDTENYSITRKRFGSIGKNANNPLRVSIERALLPINDRRTSELVEISHNEPSWKETPNGAKFFITDADMKNQFENSNSLSDEYRGEREAMQASLIRGMIDDIVNESTGLEYPDEESI